MTVHCQKPGCTVSWPRDPVLEVPCPSCKANVGVWCRKPSGHQMRGEYHADRDLLADREGKYGKCPSGRCGLLPQHPGDQTAHAQRRAQAPLMGHVPQRPLDFGLFGDDAAQLDLVDLSRSKR